MGESDIEPCAIARSLGVLGERWTFLIVREALWGATRFGEFRDALGVAPDVLTARLARLVDAGVMEKVPYQEPGSRQRWAYELTPASTSRASRALSTSGATPRASRNSPNRVAPQRASRTIRNVHRSPSTPRLRAIAQGSLMDASMSPS